MLDIATELLIILLFALANGFFAASEIALVSARRSRLEARAEEGSRGARKALALMDAPDRFLATVQVGITLIGTFSATFAGARLGELLSGVLAAVPALQPYAEGLALAFVVLLITYISLVFGELVPKRLALQSAEGFAAFAAPAVRVVQLLARPFVVLLTSSVQGVLRVLGRTQPGDSAVTPDDIVYMVRSGSEAGVVERRNAQIIEQVFTISERIVRDVMIPRTEIVAIDVDTPQDEITALFISGQYSRLPVYDGRIDNIIGVITARDFIRVMTGRAAGGIREIMLPAEFILESETIDDVLHKLRSKGTHLAIVIDEYGQTAGMITLVDLLAELVGEIRDERASADQPDIVQRADGSWLVDGLTSFDKVAQATGLAETPTTAATDFATIAGFVLAELQRIPATGDSISAGQYVIEVIDMDERRIDKLLIRRVSPSADQPSETSSV
jgi:putative hemolysin